MKNVTILREIKMVWRDVTYKVTMEAIFFLNFGSKTRLERAVEIKPNESVQNEKNSEKLKIFRSVGLVELLLENSSNFNHIFC